MNDQVAAAKRWWAQALLIGGVIAVVCLPLGALGTKFVCGPLRAVLCC